ncbi:hypothetical protein HG437_000960 [Candidatus Saccharibacteria bacterium]|nr:hypothetical protein [Candidatus Saccharibacteria bacterium]
MTSTHSSSQKFNKLEWIQQEIKETRKECGTANSGEARDKQYAEVRRRVVGALGLIATRSGEDLTPDTAGRLLYGLAISSRTGQPTQGELTEEGIRIIRKISGMAQQPAKENNAGTMGIAA